MDNAAIYRKVIADDGQLESLNDKRTHCILLTNALLSVLESFRSKIFSFNDLEELEKMVKFTRQIMFIMHKVVTESCNVEFPSYSPQHGVFFPLIRMARQFEIHSLLCYKASLLTELKKNKYFKACQKIGVLNNFALTLQPSRFFLDEYLVKTSHFHHVLPPKPKPERKYSQKYY